MKLLGVKNNTHIIASVARHDYVEYEDLMADGGQPFQDVGYNRFRGESVWFEIPESFSELYEDYQFNDKRKYGVWKIKEVKILSEKEQPNPHSMDYISENVVWGTRGKNGDQPLKYVHLKDCETDHLKAILDTQNPSNYIRNVIIYILKERNHV